MINIAILGFGIVGGGVWDVLQLNKDVIEEKLGEQVNVKHILDIRDFSGLPFAEKVTCDINTILSDDSVSIVVETMGGSHPAYEFSLAAIKSGKSVITSNKEVVANFGCELSKEAEKNGVRYLFEASVGGAVPVIRGIRTSFAGNKINSIAGILNGTTNYILTRMFSDCVSFETALKEAQEKGYAERDPSADVQGLDAARKICILADMAFGKTVLPEDVYTEGIGKITQNDVEDCDIWGGTIKLVGLTERCDDGSIYIIVCPFFIKKDHYLSGVNDVFNGISIVGNAVGELSFGGRGAGKLPTASAIVADIVEAVQVPRGNHLWCEERAAINPVNERNCEMYLRFAAGESQKALIKKAFEGARILREGDGEISIVTLKQAEKITDEKIRAVPGAVLESKIRVF